MKTTIINTALIVIVLFFFGIYFYQRLSFSGVLDKKYTRKELTQNFTKHEAEFEDLVKYFRSNIPGDKELSVSFGLSSGNKVNLHLETPYGEPYHKVIGGNDLEFGSTSLDSALTELGWTNETTKILKEKLAKTKCDWIRTTEIYGGRPIEIYPDQSGWGSFSYLIFNSALSDSLIKIHGTTISKTEFGRKVVLDYNSAL